MWDILNVGCTYMIFSTFTIETTETTISTITDMDDINEFCICKYTKGETCLTSSHANREKLDFLHNT